MSAALAFPPAAADPVAALLAAIGPEPRPAAELATLWGMAEGDALDVAAEAEASGLLATEDGPDGPVVRLTTAGADRAGVVPPGHRRMRYFDRHGVERWVIAPAEVVKAMENFDRAGRRHHSQFLANHLTGWGDDGGGDADFGDMPDPRAVPPLDALVRQEHADRTPPPKTPGERAVCTPPRPTLVLGLSCRWDGPALPEGEPCPGCGGRRLALTACCVRCDAMGNVAFLEPVRPSEMPKKQRPPEPPPKPKGPARAKPDAPALDGKPKGKAKAFRMPSRAEQAARHHQKENRK